MEDGGIADETRRRGGARGVPSQERPGIGLIKREREVAGGWRARTSPVIGEIDRPGPVRDERLAAERTGHRVGRPRRQAILDPEPEASERDLSAGPVRRRARGPAEGARDIKHQNRRSRAVHADPCDVGGREPVHEFVRKVARKRNGCPGIRKGSRQQARITSCRVQARRQLQTASIHIPLGVANGRVDAPDRAQTRTLLGRGPPSCQYHVHNHCQQDCCSFR